MFYLLEAAVLALALSLDTFAAGISLGARRIRIPAASLLALSLTCSLSLLVSILLGGLLGDWISPRAASLISCMLLCGIGGVRLFDSLVKGLLRRCCESERSFILRFQNLKIFLQVCIDSTQADFNRSNSLSCLEAVSLAIALSLDGLVAGFGSGFSAIGRISPALSFCCSLLCNLLAVLAGLQSRTAPFQPLPKGFQLVCRRDADFAGGGETVLKQSTKKEGDIPFFFAITRNTATALPASPAACAAPGQ